MHNLSGAIVKDVRERDTVLHEKIARCLGYHRLHVNPYFRANRRASNAWHGAFRQLPIKPRSALWIALNRRRQVLAAAATRSGPARIDLVAHQFSDRRLTFDSIEVNLIRYLWKTHDDPALVIDLHAAIAQPVEFIVVGRAK
jgi:hypothetical protein